MKSGALCLRTRARRSGAAVFSGVGSGRRRPAGAREVRETISSQCEPYIMRSVAKLTYTTPPEDAEAFERKSLDEASDSGDDGLQRRQQLPPGSGSRFPIHVAATEMNPKLLLTYTCEGMVLPSGARVFKCRCDLLALVPFIRVHVLVLPL